MISSTFGYAGIAIIVIFVLFTLVCALRGFSKSFNGFFCTLLAIILSLLIVGAFNDKVVDSKIGQSLETKLEKASDSWGEAFTSPARKTTIDGNEIIQIQVLDDDGNPVWIDIANARGNKIANFFVSKLAPRFITADGSGDTPSLASLIMHNLTILVVAACSFVIYLIVLLIIFSILRKITKKMSDAAKAGKAVDKILGIFVGILFALMLIWVVLAIIQACQNVGHTKDIIETYITPCKITNFFYKYNYIGKLFEQIFVG